MNNVGKIAGWVFGMVILAVIILQAGRYSYVQDNGAENYGPSGTSAFLELLKQSGYKVKIDKTLSPVASAAMVVPVSEANRSGFSSFISKLDAKTTVVAFIIPREESKTSSSQSVQNSVTGKAVGTLEPVSAKPDKVEQPLLPDAESVDLLQRQDNGASLVKVSKKGKVTLIDFSDAACVTNSNLDKQNNAGILMGLVKMVAPPGQPITYIDSFASREVENSLLAKMGPGFEAGWSQLVLLVLVIFVTLSVRFGLPPESRAAQRGGRELVDGLAWMTRRKHNARWALRAVFDRALAELERRHRIGREQIIQRPDFYMDPDSAMRLKEIEAATLDDITEREALAYAKELKRLV